MLKWLARLLVGLVLFGICLWGIWYWVQGGNGYVMLLATFFSFPTGGYVMHVLTDTKKKD